jgi:hypothetical protein
MYGGEDATVGSDEGVADFLNDLDLVDTSSGEDEPPLAAAVEKPAAVRGDDCDTLSPEKLEVVPHPERDNTGVHLHRLGLALAVVPPFTPTHCPWLAIVPEDTGESCWAALTGLYLCGGTARRILQLYQQAHQPAAAADGWATVAAQQQFCQRVLAHPIAARFPPPEEHKQLVARVLVKACSAEHADGLHEPLLAAAAVIGGGERGAAAAAAAAAAAVSGAAGVAAVGLPAASPAGFRCYTFGAAEDAVDWAGGALRATVGLRAAVQGTISLGGGGETSLALWSSGLLLADFLLAAPEAAPLRAAVAAAGQVVELGCGCGTVGIALAAGLRAQREATTRGGGGGGAAGRDGGQVEVVLTDYLAEALENCAANCVANDLRRTTCYKANGLVRAVDGRSVLPAGESAAQSAAVCTVAQLDFAEVAQTVESGHTWGLPRLLADMPDLTVLVGADLVYDPPTATLLARLVRTWLLADRSLLVVPAAAPVAPALSREEEYALAPKGPGSCAPIALAAHVVAAGLAREVQKPRGQREFWLGTEMRNRSTWLTFVRQLCHGENSHEGVGHRRAESPEGALVLEHEYLAASTIEPIEAVAKLHVVRFWAPRPAAA